MLKALREQGHDEDVGDDDDNNDVNKYASWVGQPCYHISMLVLKQSVLAEDILLPQAKNISCLHSETRYD